MATACIKKLFVQDEYYDRDLEIFETGSRIESTVSRHAYWWVYCRSMQSSWGHASMTRTIRPSMYTCRFSYCSFRPADT